MFQLLAEAVLALHFAIVLFVVGGLVVIIVGNVRGWHWVNSVWFRLLHLAAIVIVVAEVWLGITCPLTTLETWLRAQAEAGVATDYNASFGSLNNRRRVPACKPILSGAPCSPVHRCKPPKTFHPH